MSAIVTKYYKQIFKVLVTAHGFKQKGTLFYKLVNNKILQTIYLHQFSFGHSFTLNIGLFPICIGIDDELQLKDGTFRVGYLTQGYDYSWDYGFPGTKTEEVLVKETFMIVQEKVFPLFKKVIDEEKYQSFMFEFETKYYGSPIDNSSTMMWVNLKIGRYEKVLNIINKIELQNYDAAEANKVLYEEEEEYQIYLQSIENDLAEYRSIRTAIQKNDKAFLECLLQQNEEKSKKILEKLKIY
mgnify:FL=1|jgi:hypothetical protein